MSAISPTIHRALDYGTVVLFAAAPTLFAFAGGAAHLSYGLAVVHALMTVLTHFPGAGPKLVPYRVHMMVEIVVGVVLIILGFTIFRSAHLFFAPVGALILLIALLSYRGWSDAAARS